MPKPKLTMISLRDVHMVAEFARKNLTEMPARAALVGTSRSLTQPERLALAYLWAGFQVAGSHGVDTTSLTVELYTPDCETIE
jgi:hypothetical protein